MHTHHVDSATAEMKKAEACASNLWLRSQGGIATPRRSRGRGGQLILGQKPLYPYETPAKLLRSPCEAPTKHHAYSTPPASPHQATRSTQARLSLLSRHEGGVSEKLRPALRAGRCVSGYRYPGRGQALSIALGRSAHRRRSPGPQPIRVNLRFGGSAPPFLFPDAG